MDEEKLRQLHGKVFGVGLELTYDEGKAVLLHLKEQEDLITHLKDELVRWKRVAGIKDAGPSELT